MWLLLPMQVPNALQYDVYWDHEITFKVAIEPQEPEFFVSDAGTGALATQLLLNSVFRGRLSVKDVDYAALFTPCLAPAEIQTWIEQHAGSVEINDTLYNVDEDCNGLIRDLARNGVAHLLRSVQFVMSEDILANDAMDIDSPDSVTEQLRVKGVDKECMVLETSKLSRR